MIALANIFLSGALLASQLLGDAGSFLALRHASFNGDDMAVRNYLEEGLENRPNNRELLEEAVLSSVYFQDLQKASEYAGRLESQGDGSLVTAIIRFSKLVSDGEFQAAADYIREEKSLAFLDERLLEAWAVAEQDRERAYAVLAEARSAADEFAPIYLYQEALIAAHSGDFTRAVSIMSKANPPPYYSGMSFFNHIGMLVRAGDTSYITLANKDYDAQELWPEPLTRLIASARAGRNDPSLGYASPQNAIAEYLGLILPELGRNEASRGIERLFATMLPLISDGGDWQEIALIQYFLRRGEYEDVLHFAEHIKDNSPFRIMRDDFRITANFALERRDEVSKILSRLDDENISQLALLADSYRMLEDYDRAAENYEKIIKLSGLDNRRFAATYNGLGVTYDRLGKWSRAERMLRKALEHDTDNAQYLNYLGYSLVDRGENLEEGLEMINRAVDKAPEEGYIIDSLGWAYYRLGRYDDALEPLEAAASLMSKDATVNSHLGDLYWRLGREREAMFQWKRALKFVTDDTVDVTEEEIRERIENGLDG